MGTAACERGREIERRIQIRELSFVKTLQYTILSSVASCSVQWLGARVNDPNWIEALELSPVRSQTSLELPPEHVLMVNVANTTIQC